MKKVQVELIRSINGTPRWMRTIVRTLSLRKLRDTKIHPDNRAVRGMVAKVSHLVTLKELSNEKEV